MARFFGCVITKDKPFVFAEPDHMLAISQAAIADSKEAKPTKVFMEVEKQKYVVCTLAPGRTDHTALNIELAQNVTFSVVGPGTVHLVGYTQDMGDMSDEDMSYNPDESDYTDESEEGEEGQSPAAQGVKRKADMNETGAKRTKQAPTGAKAPTGKAAPIKGKGQAMLEGTSDESEDAEYPPDLVDIEASENDEDDSEFDSEEESEEEEEAPVAPVTKAKTPQAKVAAVSVAKMSAKGGAQAPAAKAKTPAKPQAQAQAQNAKAKTPAKPQAKPTGTVPTPAKTAATTPAKGPQQPKTPKSAGGAFACKQCPKTFGSQAGMDQHVNTKHKASA